MAGTCWPPRGHDWKQIVRDPSEAAEQALSDWLDKAEKT
jgi:hypothetical protein